MMVLAFIDAAISYIYSISLNFQNTVLDPSRAKKLSMDNELKREKIFIYLC